ncbi:MAG: intradiol ring-cleavage dioxygenase [Ekhidna sp.]|uniref:dioxygenase family protein n=1 Tax=Ekhidna sp. TaxID=2608089 RepID=UPI003297A893
MKNIFTFLILLAYLSGHTQTGGPCEGCEAALEYNPETITNMDTLPGFSSNEPRLKISGIVYQKDGRTPAAGVIVYIYHTNRSGIYPGIKGSGTWPRRHGKHRGWIKTNKDGRYTFYTFRPASYPNRQAPEHIHLTVKEPNKIPYYLDDYFFDNDPLLTTAERRSQRNRGGSGIVKTDKIKDGIIQIKRDIILGLNIPNYEN